MIPVVIIPLFYETEDRRPKQKCHV